MSRVNCWSARPGLGAEPTCSKERRASDCTQDLGDRGVLVGERGVRGGVTGLPSGTGESIGVGLGSIA